MESAAEARTAFSQPLPPGLDKVRGGVFAVLDGALGPDGKPTNVEAYGILASDDPAGLVDMVVKEMAAEQAPKVPADGKFHDIVPAGAVPGLGAIRGAIKPKALVAAVGAKGSDAAERAMGRTGTSPLLYMSYDYGRLMAKIMASLPDNTTGAGERQDPLAHVGHVRRERDVGLPDRSRAGLRDGDGAPVADRRSVSRSRRARARRPPRPAAARG